jgi:hypothetical protein
LVSDVIAETVLMIWDVSGFGKFGSDWKLLLLFSFGDDVL